MIDGKQRITAIADFMSGATPLTRLESFKELEGMRFDDLPAPLRNFLTVRPSLRAISLLRQSDPNLKYEVFHRLNAGGEPLNAQEIRNVLFRGKVNDLILSLAQNEFLRGQLKIRNIKSPNYRKMLDAEWVLRFLTLADIWRDFSGDLRVSMDRFMAEHGEPEPRLLGGMADGFNSSLGACEHLWGYHAFKRYEGSTWRDLALAGMYDAQMIAVAEVGPARLVSKVPPQDRHVDTTTKRLFLDSEFESL